MTKEEFKTVKVGDELYISKRPTNGDIAPEIGHVFIVDRIDHERDMYVYPTVRDKGGCWHYSYLERTSEKPLPIFN